MVWEERSREAPPYPEWASQYLREWLVERRRIIRLFVAAVALMLVATRMAHGADGQRVPVIGEVLFSTPSNAAPLVLAS